MEKSTLRLSAFGDEISEDLQVQLQTLRALRIGALELRAVWGKNVLHLTSDEVRAIAKACANHEIIVSTIGSPVGKSPITQPLAPELKNLRRILDMASKVRTQVVRVFSFYPPEEQERPWSDDDLVAESIARLTAMCEEAAQMGMNLVLENERGLVADSVTRCRMLLEGVDMPNLGFAWDPGNFASVGESSAVTDGWEALGPRTRHVHIKDYRLATSEILPAGEGEGQIDLLLKRLAAAGYDGFLALEPHLKSAGHMGGYSGADGMEVAALALRSLMARMQVAEQAPNWEKDEQR